jgi:glycerol uptake facilitator protein
MGAHQVSLTRRYLAEGLGTFLLVFFGCGAVHVAVLTGALSGLWQVAIVWGVAVTLAIYVVGGVSGAHLNPAVTIALAVWQRFRWAHVPGYILGQVAGAFAAAAALFVLYAPLLAEKDRAIGRGQPGSEITASCYGEFFPNPGTADAAAAFRAGDRDRLAALVSEPAACAAEVLGTLLLALVIFAVTDEHNLAAPTGRLAPVFIGLTVAALIVVVAPLTQACFNPARDFGPRLFTFLAGWGSIALPGLRGTGWFTVYLLAPVVGAVAGGGLYLYAVRPGLSGPHAERIIRS